VTTPPKFLSALFELIRKGLEPVVPASHRDNPVAVGGEASYDRRAEAGGCSCDEDLQFNLLTRGFDVCCNGLEMRETHVGGLADDTGIFSF
jgi:hypothetical protein